MKSFLLLSSDSLLEYSWICITRLCVLQEKWVVDVIIDKNSSQTFFSIFFFEYPKFTLSQFTEVSLHLLSTSTPAKCLS